MPSRSVKEILSWPPTPAARDTHEARTHGEHRPRGPCGPAGVVSLALIAPGALTAPFGGSNPNAGSSSGGTGGTGGGSGGFGTLAVYVRDAPASVNWTHVWVAFSRIPGPRGKRNERDRMVQRDPDGHGGSGGAEDRVATPRHGEARGRNVHAASNRRELRDRRDGERHDRALHRALGRAEDGRSVQRHGGTNHVADLGHRPQPVDRPRGKHVAVRARD